jgi:type IV secretion system protein VirB8
MNEPSTAKREAYLAQADSWAKDRLVALHASRRIALIVASAAMVVAICEALALLVLMPLKRVEPYTLLVDRQTGYVQLLKPLEPQLVGSETALTQSFLVQYVIAREGYDIDAVQSDYRKVAAWSTGAARSDYLARMPAANPESPLARYPRTTTIDVEVKSITSLSDHVALIRFDTIRHDAGQQPAPGRPWIAVVRYDYVNKPMTAADRFINPLGFQVVRYRRSAEALTPTRVGTAGSASAPVTTGGAITAAPAVSTSSSNYGAYRP